MLFFAEQGGQLERAEADGNVVSRQEARRAFGKHLTYNAKDDTYTMTGAPVDGLRRRPAELQADQAPTVAFRKERQHRQRDRRTAPSARRAKPSPAAAARGRTRWRRCGPATSPSRTAAARSCAGVNLEIASGEVVGLLGPNGAGKTTTFSMVVGLTAPDSGRVLLDGKDVTDDPMYVRARKGIGYLPQEASIFRGLTVEQNIMAILETLDLDGADAAGAAARAAGRARV